jgi:hypothetical protein
MLKIAVQSALRQTYQDLEILVSDNYCGNEETRKVYESFQDPRLKYVRTDRLLAMPDSWEFALSHAKGEYVTILSDDSFFLPYAIERGMAAVKEYKLDLAAWNICTYYSPDWFEPHLRNHLFVAEPPYNTAVLSSQDVTRKLFDLQLDVATCMPRFLNSICHQRLVAKVRQRQGRMFLPPCPDFSAAAGLLLNTDRYVFVGWPLGINGYTPRSIGVTLEFNSGEAFKEFLGEFEETGFRRTIDLNLATVPVSVAQTLEVVKSNCPHECIPYQVNRWNMLRQSIKSVAVHERNGADVGEAWRILDTYIAGQPEDIKRAAVIQKRRSRFKFMLRGPVARIIHCLPGWEHVFRLRGQDVFHGARYNFQNMEQCGQVAPQLIARVANAKDKRARRTTEER